MRYDDGLIVRRKARTRTKADEQMTLDGWLSQGSREKKRHDVRHVTPA